MTIRNSKSQKMKRNLQFPYKSGRPIIPKSDEIIIKKSNSFKCPYCHIELIKDLKKHLNESKSNYEECCNCNGLIWRKQLENEI